MVVVGAGGASVVVGATVVGGTVVAGVVGGAGGKVGVGSVVAGAGGSVGVGGVEAGAVVAGGGGAAAGSSSLLELLGDVGKALVTLGGSRRQRCEQCTARRPSLERSNRSQKWSAGLITVKRFHRLALQDFAITVDTHFGNDLA